MRRLVRFNDTASQQLWDADPVIAGLLEREDERQRDTLAMVASMSQAPPAVLAAAGSALSSLTTEGYPSARFHGGCELADQVEELAVERARLAFAATYANVQPHSGSSANLAALFELMHPGDRLLAMDLSAGGHLTHGSPASITSTVFQTTHYGVDADGWIDYDEVEALAQRDRPTVIICGASSYPRTIDFARFRAIADEVGAWLVADISHIAGLVATGCHPSPIDHAHVTTTSTYKQLCGPRGGLILSGRDAAEQGPKGRPTLASALQRAVFPRTQGTPDLGGVAAKAVALGIVTSVGFAQTAMRIQQGAAALADQLDDHGHRLVTGGTDTHMVVMDLRDQEVTGAHVEDALGRCGIVVNRNCVPGDERPVRVTSGVRVGTNSAALRGLGPLEMRRIADWIDVVVAAINPQDQTAYTIDDGVIDVVGADVSALCHRFPLPGQPTVLPAGVMVA